MLAVTVTPGGSPALRELPSPTAPPGGVLVRVRACGLCGSDVEKLRPGGAAAGSVLGHEIAGVVVDGALPAGLRVALAHHVPCGACASCDAGHEPLCAAFVASALEPGGFCELTAASAGARRARRAAAARPRQRPRRLVRRAAGLRPARHRRALPGDAARGRRGLDRPARRAGAACARHARAGARARSGPSAARSRARLRSTRRGRALLRRAAVRRRSARPTRCRLLEPGGHARALQRRQPAAARRRSRLPPRAHGARRCARPRRAICARRSR